MSDRLVTLATFPAPAAANFMKSLLIAEGMQAYLADEIAVGMLWHLSIAIGWVKLQVAEADVARATQVLEEYRQAVDELGQEAFAAEAISSPAADEESDNLQAATLADERDDDVVVPMDDLASRALRSAVIGLVWLPVAFYGAWLVGRLIFSKSELSAKASRNLWLAFGINFVLFLEYSAILGPTDLIVGYGVTVAAAFCIREVVRWVNRRHSVRAVG